MLVRPRTLGMLAIQRRQRQGEPMPVAPPRSRLRRVLRLVDDLDLDRGEIAELRAALETREKCELDPNASREDLELAQTIKRRIESGKAISMRDGLAIVRRWRGRRTRQPASG
jgi:hypothetical protein